MEINDVNSLISSLSNNTNNKYIIFNIKNINKINTYEKITETMKLILYIEEDRFLYEYKREDFDLFDSGTSVNEYYMEGICNFNNNIIEISGEALKKYVSYKQTLDSDGVDIKKREILNYNFNIDDLINKWTYKII